MDTQSLAKLFSCYDHQKELLVSINDELSIKDNRNIKSNLNYNLDQYVARHIKTLSSKLLKNNINKADTFVAWLDDKEANDYGCYFKGYDYLREYLFERQTLNQIASSHNTSKQSVSYGISTILGGLDEQ